jgi:alpha-glucosidase
VGEIPWPPPQTGPQVDHPHWDRDEVHEIYRDWRDLADEYSDPRVFVAEAWVTRPERLARYVRADELHTAFNFDFLLTPWLAHTLRTSITDTIASHREVAAPPTWVLSNHDVAREVSRYARPQSDRRLRSLDDLLPLPSDPDLGVRRARAAALLMLALPGGAYIYQGEELGLPEVEDLPDEVLDDPKFEQSGRTSRGRDGCRVPLPWSGDRPPFGFSPDGVNPWLPQPEQWRTLTAEAGRSDPASMLSLYRSALRIRREHPALGDGDLEWLDMPDGTIGFTREPGFGCLVNLPADPLALPTGWQILLASGPLTDDGRIPADTALWLTRR